MKQTLPELNSLLRVNANRLNKLIKERKQLLIKRKALRKV